MSLNIEHLIPRDSIFSRFDGRWKLASIILAVGLVAALRSPWVLLVTLMATLLLATCAQVPGRWFRARLGVLLITLLPFVAILPFIVDRGGPTVELFGLMLHRDGIFAAVAVVCKSLAIVSLMLILLASAPLHETLRAAQYLRIPGLLVQLTLLSYRYVFLLLDELNRIRIALRTRGFRNRANRHSYKTIGQVTGTLIVRGVERAERVSQAMRCRGYSGSFRSLHSFHTSRTDVGLFLVIVSIFAGLFIWDLLI